jgi:hypothetical protein
MTIPSIIIRRFIFLEIGFCLAAYISDSQLTSSSILLFLSLGSFIPQYRRIVLKGNGNGISLYYILFNLVSATEQFTLGLHIVVDNRMVFDSVISTPPTAGDWLNFAQFTVVWLCHLAL